MFFYRYPVAFFSYSSRLCWSFLAAVALVLIGVGLVTSPAAQAEESAVARVNQENRGSSKPFWTEERIAEAVANPPRAALEAGAAPLGRGRQLRHSPPDYRNPAIGKIIFTVGRYAGSCSGTLLESRSRRIVLTAAHCLKDRGVWSRRIQFMPGYDRGSAPYGRWGWRRILVTQGWANSSTPWNEGNPNFDLGLIVLNQRLGDRIDGVDFQTFPRRDGRTRILGYPGGALAGRQLRMCQTSTWAGPGFSYGLPGPTGMAGYCDMAPGSSGGPWLSDYTSPTDPNITELVLDGVTSTGNSKRGTFSSPYLGSQFVTMLRRAQN